MQVVFKNINYIAQAAFVEFWTGIVFRENAFKLPVLLLQRFHCCINDNSYFSSKRSLDDFIPTGICRNKKDVVTDIFIRVFLKAGTLCYKFIVLNFEAVVDVF